MFFVFVFLNGDILGLGALFHVSGNQTRGRSNEVSLKHRIVATTTVRIIVFVKVRLNGEFNLLSARKSLYVNYPHTLND